MQSIVKTIIGITLGSLVTASAAHAHYLWIEPSDTGVNLYYGEADALIKEKSPGKLDNIRAPQAFVQDVASSKMTAVAVSRTPGHFSIASDKQAVTIQVAEESLPVRDLTQGGLGLAKSNYYARSGQFGTGNGSAAPLALDIQANGSNGLTVLYRGQPLKDARLEVIAPNTWVQEHKTDAAGKVEINTPWRGQYVIHVLHVDQTAGEFAGKKYASLRNHFTYTFIKAEGADPGPAMAPHRID